MRSPSLSRWMTKPIASVVCCSLLTVIYPTITQAAPTSSLPTLPGSNIPADYLLGGGDRIRINILDVPEYSGEYIVPPGGLVYLPLIGSVSVQGLNQSQAADLISSRYARFLKRPLVTVSLQATRPINFVVSGEVNSPGSFTAGEPQAAGTGVAVPNAALPTVVSAIQTAQGVTLAADVSNVQIHRRQGVGLPDQVITVNLRNLVQNGSYPNDLTLRDGDTIYVPTASQTNLAENRQFATTNFAAPQTLPRTVTVVGEVNRPGPYVVIGGATSGQTTLTAGGTIAQGTGSTAGAPTVSRAIQLAGGITSTADIRHIQIHRATRTGGTEIIMVDMMRLVERGDVSQDAYVQEGDSIVIPRATVLTPAEQTKIATTNIAPDTIQVSVIGEAKNPGFVKLPPNTPLNQALLAAGGFNNSRASRDAVDLIRLNPDGTVTKRHVKVDFANGLNEATNPYLRNNDIIVVYRNGLTKTTDTLTNLFSPFLSLFGTVNAFRGY